MNASEGICSMQKKKTVIPLSCKVYDSLQRCYLPNTLKRYQAGLSKQ